VKEYGPRKFLTLITCTPKSYKVDSGLKNHTLYLPTNPPATLKLPVLAWGETGCTHDALVFLDFLTEVASYGILVIANGDPHGTGNPNGVADTQHPDGSPHQQAIDWITSAAGKGEYSNVDASRIAVAGQSCGGLQAYMLALDPRVTAIGIFNSGFINATDPLPTKITKPIFYFLGGSTDIAYANVCSSRARP
jgi:dienelactone hydrolase